MGMTLKHSRKSSVIHLEGVIDIESASEFKKLLLRAFESGKEIRVALDGATEMDVTAVQLIWAARRAWEGAGLAFKVSGEVSAPASLALSNAGLQQLLAHVDAR